MGFRLEYGRRAWLISMDECNQCNKKTTKQRSTINRSWMIRNEVCQFDLNKETWKKRIKGKNVEFQMPNLGPQALFYGSSRTIKVCDAMCMVN